MYTQTKDWSSYISWCAFPGHINLNHLFWQNLIWHKHASIIKTHSCMNKLHFTLTNYQFLKFIPTIHQCDYIWWCHHLVGVISNSVRHYRMMLLGNTNSLTSYMLNTMFKKGNILSNIFFCLTPCIIIKFIFGHCQKWLFPAPPCQSDVLSSSCFTELPCSSPYNRWLFSCMLCIYQGSADLECMSRLSCLLVCCCCWMKSCIVALGVKKLCCILNVNMFCVCPSMGMRKNTHRE